MRSGFSLIEMIFVIIVIGIISAVAIPRLGGVSDKAKVSAEMSNAANIQTEIARIHGEWILYEGYEWKPHGAAVSLNTKGYPADLSSTGLDVDYILPDDKDVFLCNSTSGGQCSNLRYHGIASKNGTGCVPSSIKGKPDCGDYWEYNATTGKFLLVEDD
jgi:prepilin-type N-terminal cleavage/methylation domain-containing protein